MEITVYTDHGGDRGDSIVASSRDISHARTVTIIVAFANGYARPCARIIFSAQKCIGILYPKAKPSDTHITILSIFLKPNQCNQPCHEHMLHSGSRDQSESFSPIGSSCPTGRCHAWHLCRLYTKIFGHVPGVQPSLQTKV